MFTPRKIQEDKTILLFGLALLMAFVCYFVILGSVHNYCDNRPIVGVLAIVPAVILVLLIRNRTAPLLKRVLSSLGIIICMLTTGAGIAFIWFATKVCR